MTRSASIAGTAQGPARRRVAALAGLLLLGTAAYLATSPAAAQSLPVTVEASGNNATIQIGGGDESVSTLSLARAGHPGMGRTEVSLDFDRARGLSADTLGVTAERISPDSPVLRGRLPDAQLTALADGLPLLVTIEPSGRGGFAFDRTVRVEIHTDDLEYTPGSSYRLFKASPGEGFRDITDEIAPGSVRARGTTGGFSQFLIVEDLRETRDVIDEKVDRLRNLIHRLPGHSRGQFDAHLDTAVAAVDSGDYANAIAALDMIRAEAADAANSKLASTWQPVNARPNHAGELIAGAATLKFSIAYLRDFGD